MGFLRKRTSKSQKLNRIRGKVNEIFYLVFVNAQAIQCAMLCVNEWLKKKQEKKMSTRQMRAANGFQMVF